VAHAHIEAALFHGSAEPLEERPIVVDDDERTISRQLILLEGKVF